MASSLDPGLRRHSTGMKKTAKFATGGSRALSIMNGTSNTRGTSTNRNRDAKRGTAGARASSTGFEGLEDSPRLFGQDSGPFESTGSPLLPPPAPQAGEAPDERFCTAGPNLDGSGTGKNKLPSTAGLTFVQVVAMLDAAMGQASLLLNDRLHSLLARLSSHSVITQEDETELCDIADGLSSASYHTQKWTYICHTSRKAEIHRGKTRDGHALDLAHAEDSTVLGNHNKKPTRPQSCSEFQEAVACMHFVMPRLMVNAAEAQKCLVSIIKTYGSGAELHAKKLGIVTNDIRSLVPHLERLIARLGRLTSSLRPRIGAQPVLSTQQAEVQNAVHTATAEPQ